MSTQNWGYWMQNTETILLWYEVLKIREKYSFKAWILVFVLTKEEKQLVLKINFLMNALLGKLKWKVKMPQCSNFIDILQYDY